MFPCKSPENTKISKYFFGSVRSTRCHNPGLHLFMHQCYVQVMKALNRGIEKQLEIELITVNKLK